MMKKSGFQMVYEAALASDAELTDEQKRQISLVLRGGDVADDGVEQLLLTQRQACKALGVSRFTIFRMVRDGQLHPVLIRGVKRYQTEELHKIAREGVAA